MNPRPTRRYPKGTWMKLTSPDTLRALINQRDFTVTRLGRYAGCTPGFICHLLAGRKTSCKPATAQAIAEALDIPLEILFVPKQSAGSGNNVRSAA